MQQKRGQLTILIVITIVLLASILFFFLFTEKENTAPDRSSSFTSAQEEVSYCLEENAKSLLTRIGFRGGYYQEPLTEYIDFGNALAPIYYMSEKTYVPSIIVIEEELKKGFEIEMVDCLLMEEENISFTYSSVNVSIKESGVSFQTDLRLNIPDKENGLKSFDYEDREIFIPSKVMHMRHLAHDIITLHETFNENLCMTCITDMAREKDLLISIKNEDYPLLQFSILDNSTKTLPFEYRFFILDSIEKETSFSLEKEFENIKDEEEINTSFIKR